MSARVLLRAVTALALAAGLHAGSACDALATTGPGVGVRLHAFTPATTPGGPATFEIRLEAREALMIENLRVEAASPRASVRGETPAAAMMLPSGETRVLSFTGEGLDEAGDVRVRFTANGRPVVKRFDFSRANREKQRRPHAMVRADDARPSEGPHAPDLLIPGPGRPRQRGADEKPVRIAKPSGASAVNALIRVHGQVSYIRDDGVRIGADAVTIRVYDEDWDWDELVAEFRTETSGQFDKTLSFDEDEPDIYLEIETTNAAVTVENGSFWETNYVFRTGVHTDYTGSDLFFGTLQPADESLYPSLHIHTNMTRAWRWWAQQRDQTPDHLEVQWPDSDWPHYDGSEIHIPQAVNGTIYGWESGTHVHEYAHHLHYQFFSRDDSDYDNGICNNPNGDPGHCSWCQETGATAVNEGWPNWYSTYVLERYPQTYSSSAIHMKNTERLGACTDANGLSCSCSPNSTEGFFQVLFRDLEDDTPAEQDPRSANEHAFDKIDMSVHALLDAMQLGVVTRTVELVPAVKAMNPGISDSDWWHTLNNAGFAQADVGKPTLPGQFYSTSHTTSQSSTRRIIMVEWQPGVDHESGIRGYYLYSGTSLRAPTASDELVAADHSEWYTGLLTVPGPYYVSIRAVDNAGNLSNDWKWVGPYTLRNPEPPDMEAGTPAGNGWYRPLVARDDDDAAGNTIQPTASLPGDALGTWVNVYGRNHGEQATSANSVKIKIDGVTVRTEPVASLSPGIGIAKLNLGPFQVRGGRHAVEAYWEADEEISENLESDNDYRTQYTWLPYTFPSIITGSILRDGPPMRDAGRLGMDPTQTFYWNVDGLRFRHRLNPLSSMTSWWSGVTLDPVNPYSDYDLRLHETSNLSGIGFDTVVGSSTRSEGVLDAVFSNRRAHTSDAWDVGVLNADSSLGQYRARLIQAPTTSLVVGDSATITQGQHTLMTLRELSVDAAAAGPIEVIAQVMSGPLDLYGLRFSVNFQKGGIDNYIQKVAADDDGRIVMRFTGVADTHVPLAFYRNPSTSRPESTVTFKLIIRKPLADLVASTPNTAWHAPLVPKESSGSYFLGVPAPDELIGDAQQTWLNYTYANIDVAFGGLVYNRVRLDDDLIHTRLNNGMSADQRHTSFNVGPFTIAGGRHVLSLALDNNGAVAEENEVNNLWGEQWVWQPDSIQYDRARWRTGTVGAMNAKWGYVTVNEELWPNADGLRLPYPPAPTHWFGVAVMPRAGSDVDLQLHEIATDPKSGFEDARVVSAWGEGQLDYVLFNHDQIFRRTMDVGIVRPNPDTASYLVQPQRAILWSPPTGNHTIRLEPGIVLDLYEFDLTPDTWRFQLVQTGTSAATDWGMALHRRESFFTYSSRSEAESLSSYIAGTSQPETFVANITTSGRYCLAVWRNDPDDVHETGRAVITITAGTVAADGTLPSRTGLQSAWPNPVADRTTLRFDLARDGDVVLELFDVRGSLVRTLAKGTFAAGRHEAPWDGRDDRGNLLPPGLYLARLNAAGETSTLKLTRLD